MNLGGFSWKRFLGISAARSRLSRTIGIPLTRGGRERKLGRMITGGGGLVIMGLGITIPIALVIVAAKVIGNCPPDTSPPCATLSSFQK